MFSSTSFLLASAILGSLIHTAISGPLDCISGPCVTVEGVGKLQGSWENTQWSHRRINQFMGIPFGETTAGEYRFAPPRAKAPLNDGNHNVYDASYFSWITNWWDRVCPQPGLNFAGELNPMLAMQNDSRLEEAVRGLPGAVIGSEDCLHLAVHTPELPSANHNPKLPVMVYIHGGSFMLGGYIGAGPRKLLERDMVLVSLQYRVGPLGFLCLPDDQIGGNVGLMDQLLALQWVHDHIADFGGDPDRVTIQGESAGSASVTYHLLSPLSQPYFHQAIAESGSALSGWAFDSKPEQHGKNVSKHIGCPTDDMNKLVTCLKGEKTHQEIVLGHNQFVKTEREAARMGFGGSSPCSQTHGAQKFVDKHPKEYLMERISNPPKNPKKAMFGSNKHEGSFVLGMIYNSYLQPNDIMNDEDFLRYYFSSTLLEALGLKEDSGVIYELINYRFFKDHELGNWDLMIDGLINMVGTFFIKASTYEFMKFHDLGNAETYFYSFEHYGGPSLWNFLFPGGIPGDPIPRGVTHGDELIYLFSAGVFDLTFLDWEIARVISNLWANFVIHGDPTSPEFPIRIPDPSWEPTEESVERWPLWRENASYMRIDKHPKVLQNFIATWEDPEYNNSV